jgi:hypothetical protein
MNRSITITWPISRYIIHQPINQSGKRFIICAVLQSADQSTDRPMGHPIIQSSNQATNSSINLYTDRPIKYSIDQSTNQSNNQAAHQPTNQLNDLSSIPPPLDLQHDVVSEPH